jgi:hypothetical protein
MLGRGERGGYGGGEVGRQLFLRSERPVAHRQ